MVKPHPIELRERVVAFVEEGHSNRSAAARFRVSPRFVNDLVILNRDIHSLALKRRGNPGIGELSNHSEWIRWRLGEHGDLTLDELCLELAGRDVSLHRSSVCRLLNRLGLSHKEKAFEQKSVSGWIFAKSATSSQAVPPANI